MREGDIQRESEIDRDKKRHRGGKISDRKVVQEEEGNVIR